MTSHAVNVLSNLLLCGVESSLKLGIGDFVFYNVLVSRAALQGFTTFIICYVAILGVRYELETALLCVCTELHHSLCSSLYICWNGWMFCNYQYFSSCDYVVVMYRDYW